MKKSNLIICGTILLTFAMGGSSVFAKVSGGDAVSTGAAIVEASTGNDSGKVYVPYAAPSVIRSEHSVGSGSVSFASSTLRRNSEDPNFSVQFSTAVKEAMRAKAAGTRIVYNQSGKKLEQQRWEHLAVNR